MDSSTGRLVVDPRCLRLAADARPAVARGGRERAVRRAPPGEVEPAGELRGRSSPRGGRRGGGRRPAPRRPDLLHRDPAPGELAQRGDRGGVGRDAVGLRRVAARGRASEQQPVQRRGGRGRRRHPPRDHLAARPGERDVEQPQVLARLLGVVPRDPLLPAVAGLAADVEHPGAGVVVQQRDVRVADVAVPRERHVHDRELQALAAVHRDDLHGSGVGLQPPAALDPHVLGGLGDAVAQPLHQRGRAEVLVHGRGVQRLADVAQVGEPPLAVGDGEQAAAAARCRW